VDAALRNGSTIHVRPALEADRPAIEAFLHALSPQSIGFRFLTRLSALVDAHPEIAELDANLLPASHSGALIVDARIRIAPAT